jgi:hypothetical protein
LFEVCENGEKEIKFLMRKVKLLSEVRCRTEESDCLLSFKADSPYHISIGVKHVCGREKGVLILSGACTK